jgi:hypothetical protein
MPAIICDTGPPVALSSLGLLEILSRLYSPIVTRAVLDEWRARQDRPDLSSNFEIIDVAPPDPLLAVQLDRGEASVIQAAMERGCKRVLLDERKARKRQTLEGHRFSVFRNVSIAAFQSPTAHRSTAALKHRPTGSAVPCLHRSLVAAATHQPPATSCHGSAVLPPPSFLLNWNCEHGNHGTHHRES